MTDGMSGIEHRIYGKLQGEGDVAISVLYRAITRRWPLCSSRTAQMRVGRHLVDLNAKLAPSGWRVVPGTRRRTYCLRKIG